jgi:hypothetical protein
VSVNKYKPHVWVVPEDDADEALVNGFLLAPAVNVRVIDVERPAGGWKHVLKVFADEYIPHLRRHKDGHVVLLLDFDEADDRRAVCEAAIPDDLKPRVFLIGAWTNPETLRNELGQTLEAIGARAAANCVRDEGFWNHPQLAHNVPEVARIAATLKPILFGS